MATWSCAACGGENPEGMRFCGHCGSPAEAPAAALATTPAADVTDALRSFVTGQVADRLVEAGGKLTEERRLVTALFADVSGFTSLAERLDPEQLLEVIDPVVSALSDVVGRYEGFVEKFAGDALLALFGAPVSHEDDPERALMVAMEMHRELASMRERLPGDAADLTLHVGVNSGHGIARMIGSEVRMDYAVLGDSVILAQRLESAAPANETYVGETTFRLARHHFEFEPVGELTLKGKAKPVPAWRLVGEQRARTTRAPLDGREVRLVGRERELAMLRAVVDAVETGRGGIVELTGEPGVGKSRLTAAVRDHAESAGFRWLETRCLSYGSGLPYWPYAELLRGNAAIRGEDSPEDAAARLVSVAEAMPDAVPFFARLLGLPGTNGVAMLEPEAFRRGLHDAFVRWLDAESAATPLVLAVEDVHWADASSLALTHEVAAATSSAALLLYLTGRPEASEKLEPSVTATRLTLEPLSPDAAADLVGSVLDGDPPAGLVEIVDERGGGNPFFIEELVRSLQDQGTLVRTDGRWRLDRSADAASLPPTVEGVLSARIDLLPRAAASLLQAASAVGRRVPIALLESIEPDGLDELERLRERGFLEPAPDEAGLLVFHHALVQDAAYARLLRRQKRDLHRRIAEAAETLYGSGEDAVDLLARHLYLGEAGAKAAEYLERAGRRASQLFANEEAILHFERAIEVAQADGDLADRRPRLLLALAELCELTGDYERALDLYEEVRLATNDLRAWCGKAAVLRKRGDYGAAIDVVEIAFRDERLRDGDLTPLWLEHGWILSVSGRFDQAIDVLQAGLTATPSRTTMVVGRLLLQLAHAELIEGRRLNAIEHAQEAQRIFKQLDDLHGLAHAFRVLGTAYSADGREDEAVSALRQGLALAERIGSVEEIGGSLINLGLALQSRGELDEAIECDRRAVDLFDQIGHGAGRAQGYANLADKLKDAKRYDDATVACVEALEIAHAIGHSLSIADTTETLAEIALERGDYPEAARRGEEAAALYLEMNAAAQAARALDVAADAWEHEADEQRARDARARARSLTSA
jgi:adenylate cyclase